MRERIAAGGIADEDERSADWIHLLPGPPADALVVGCGWGAVASALASRGAHVVAVDPSAARVAFLAVRAQQDGLDVRCVRASTAGDLPLLGPFDLVAFVDPPWPGDPERTAREAERLLRPGGSLAWRAADPVALGVRGRTSRRARVDALRRHGFGEPRAYAPLPWRGIPVFHVPLGDTRAMLYFLTTVLPLAGTASPETRRRYGMAARLATAAPTAARVPGLSRLAELVVPGSLLIARKGATHAR